MPHRRPPEPWSSFLADIDGTLDHHVVLHCIGGFAIAMLYDLPRPTVDVDCLSVIPLEETAPLQSLAGEGSALHKKHGVYLQRNSARDREDIKFLAHSAPLDLSVLESRYLSELRPYLEDRNSGTSMIPQRWMLSKAWPGDHN